MYVFALQKYVAHVERLVWCTWPQVFRRFRTVLASFYNAIKRYKHVNLFCEREPTKMPKNSKQ